MDQGGDAKERKIGSKEVRRVTKRRHITVANSENNRECKLTKNPMCTSKESSGEPEPARKDSGINPLGAYGTGLTGLMHIFAD